LVKRNETKKNRGRPLKYTVKAPTDRVCSEQPLNPVTKLIGGLFSRFVKRGETGGLQKGATLPVKRAGPERRVG